MSISRGVVVHRSLVGQLECQPKILHTARITSDLVLFRNVVATLPNSAFDPFQIDRNIRSTNKKQNNRIPLSSRLLHHPQIGIAGQGRLDQKALLATEKAICHLEHGPTGIYRRSPIRPTGLHRPGNGIWVQDGALLKGFAPKPRQRRLPRSIWPCDHGESRH